MMTGHGVVVRAGAILEDDMVGSDQAIPVVTNFRTPPEVDARQPQDVGRLVGASADNRQFDFRGWRDVRGWDLCLRDAGKLDVKIGRRPCWIWLGNVDHAEAQT